MNKKILKSSYWFIFKYLLFKYKIYKEQKVTNLKPFKFLEWHRGAYYFTGLYKNKKVFIKTDYCFKLLKNELNAYKELKENPKVNQHIVNVLYFSKKRSFIIMDYLESKSITNYFDTIKPEEILPVLHKMLELILELQTHKLVHRDINLKNFIIVGKEIYLIDFLFCIQSNNDVYHSKIFLKELSKKVKQQERTLKYMNFNNQIETFLWDDMYALKNIFKHISAKYKLNIEQELEMINTYIGICQYKYKV